jgi:hypothetical protein
MHRLFQAGAGLFLAAMASCAPLPPTAAVAVPPVPAGEARAWFYRDPGTYDCLGTPYIRMNQGIVGVSQIGGATYRNVLPGQYLVSVDSYLTAPDQTRNVYLFPGQQNYFKIVCLRNWITGGGGRNDGGGYSRDMFWVWDIPSEIAQGDVARSRFDGGS